MIFDGKLVLTKIVVETLIIKIQAVLSSCMGYIFALLTMVLTIFGDKAMLFNYVLGAMLIDQFWGMASAKKRKRFALSTSILKLVVKLAIYLTLFVMVMTCETVLDKDWILLTRITTTLLVSAELLSSCAHILIVAPNTPIVRLFKDVLIGEIAKKLQLKTEELEKTLWKNEENEKHI